MDHKPDRILVLVPHEPTDDPRVEWVTKLCATVARVDVIGTTYSTALRAREYDGTVYVERVNILETASPRALSRSERLNAWNRSRAVVRYVEREGRSNGDGLFSDLNHHRAAALRHFANNANFNLLTDALYRRGRAVSIPPRLIVCHDIFALAAGVRLKELFGCKLLYDSHEFWPEADLMAQGWQNRLVADQERRLIRHSDAVVTVSPPLATRLQALYGLEHVISCPNAAPFDPTVKTSPNHRSHAKVKFLVQGRMAPRRGYEELLSAWDRIHAHGAVLYMRCPPNEYLTVLRERYAELERTGRLVILPAVGVDELVSAATFADVGVIAYPAETKAHLEACPNKLSQFMQAGLAILANQLPYVNEVTSKAGCGLAFDLNNSTSLVTAVEHLVREPEKLAEMKRNARRAGRDWFNWEVQSREYAQAIQRLVVEDARN